MIAEMVQSKKERGSAEIYLTLTAATVLLCLSLEKV